MRGTDGHNIIAVTAFFFKFHIFYFGNKRIYVGDVAFLFFKYYYFNNPQFTAQIRVLRDGCSGRTLVNAEKRNLFDIYYCYFHNRDEFIPNILRCV